VSPLPSQAYLNVPYSSSLTLYVKLATASPTTSPTLAPTGPTLTPSFAPVSASLWVTHFNNGAEVVSSTGASSSAPSQLLVCSAQSIVCSDSGYRQGRSKERRGTTRYVRRRQSRALRICSWKRHSRGVWRRCYWQSKGPTIIPSIAPSAPTSIPTMVPTRYS
jgi:hypothetical protein